MFLPARSEHQHIALPYPARQIRAIPQKSRSGEGMWHHLRPPKTARSPTIAHAQERFSVPSDNDMLSLCGDKRCGYIRACEDAGQGCPLVSDGGDGVKGFWIFGGGAPAGYRAALGRFSQLQSDKAAICWAMFYGIRKCPSGLDENRYQRGNRQDFPITQRCSHLFSHRCLFKAPKRGIPYPQRRISHAPTRAPASQPLSIKVRRPLPKPME